MSDFGDLRRQLRSSRNDRDAASTAMAAAREELRQIADREAQLARTFNADDPQHATELAALRKERTRVRASLTRARTRRATAVAAEANVIEDFAVFTDPRQGIGRLSDSIPILMMPVRLETRFKTSQQVPGAAAVDQLWVRVYPDDCWVDSFDPALTTTELANASAYWTSMWQAGGIEDQQRGAWRTLASAHGSGRAAWIVQRYRPTNIAAQPTKAAAHDVILTIVADAAFAAAEATALAAFWRSTWLADGDTGQAAAARAALDAAVGQSRADELVATTVPANFSMRTASRVNARERCAA